jgi:molybdate transport system substrate-binding protein
MGAAAKSSAFEIRVASSGGFKAAYLALVPAFESTTGCKVRTEWGSSLGNAPTSIPSRLRRGEPLDLAILSGDALDGLMQEGRIVAGSRVDLARSGIGVAVRAGASRPDIGSVEAFKRALGQARSIAHSSSASGVYLESLFQRLGIAAELAPKIRKVEGEPVAQVVARGEAEIGFQQVSELLPVAGIDYVGPLPAEIQEVTVFAAGIPVGAPHPEAARALVEFLTSAAAAPIISNCGMEQATRRAQ